MNIRAQSTKLPKMIVNLILLISVLSANATSEVKAQLRVNDVIAESWADNEDMFNMINNKVNSVPSVSPSYDPTRSPTATPSGVPSVSFAPSGIPSVSPTAAPTGVPSGAPSLSPTAIPSASPSLSSMPSEYPTSSPSVSSQPTPVPTNSPTLSPSESPTPQPTNQPTTSPTASPSGTPSNSPTLAPTSSAPPSLAPTLKTMKKDMLLIENPAPRSTSLLIIGACAFVAVASTGVYLYSRGAQSERRQNNGYGAPITEVSADRDFEQQGGMISPMSRVSGLPRFSYEPKDNSNPNKRKLKDDDTDVERGEIPKSVYISTPHSPNTTAAVSDNLIIKGVQKYFKNAKQKELKSNHKRGKTWNEIREEGSPACSSGCAPASVPSMFSPVLVHGLPALLEKAPSASSSNDADSSKQEFLAIENGVSLDSSYYRSLAIAKSHSRELALVASRSMESGTSRPIAKSHSTQSRGSDQLGINKSRSTESSASRSVVIKKTGSLESSQSMYANILKSVSTGSNGTRSVKSKNSFFALHDDEGSNDDEAVLSVKSNHTRSVQSHTSSKSGQRENEIQANGSPIAESPRSEINTLLASIKKANSEEQTSELYPNETNESSNDVPMSYSQTPPGSYVKTLSFSPRSLCGSTITNIPNGIHAKEQIAGQIEDFVFEANFDSASFREEQTRTPSNGAQLLSPITYERELQISLSNQEFSFKNLLNDPHNELYECHAPPGPLGIVIDSTPLGPRVKSLNPMSSLFDSMSPGDIIVGVDDVDTVGMEAAEFWQLVSRKANQRKRILTMLKI